MFAVSRETVSIRTVRRRSVVHCARIIACQNCLMPYGTIRTSLLESTVTAMVKLSTEFLMGQELAQMFAIGFPKRLGTSARLVLGVRSPILRGSVIFVGVWSGRAGWHTRGSLSVGTIRGCWIQNRGWIVTRQDCLIPYRSWSAGFLKPGVSTMVEFRAILFMGHILTNFLAPRTACTIRG